MIKTERQLLQFLDEQNIPYRREAHPPVYTCEEAERLRPDLPAISTKNLFLCDKKARSFYLVMTHSHELDLGICHAILARGDAAYCGLIGSSSKRRRFEKRLQEHGLGQARVERLVCPIGIDGIKGKLPAAIAIATAAEILQEYENRKDQENTT